MNSTKMNILEFFHCFETQCFVLPWGLHCGFSTTSTHPASHPLSPGPAHLASGASAVSEVSPEAQVHH
jgi:hypothetical protein